MHVSHYVPRISKPPGILNCVKEPIQPPPDLAEYLVEAQRYESPTSATPVPFTDQNGKTRSYNINNSDTAIMARVLLAEFPDMPIETRGK